MTHLPTRLDFDPWGGCLDAGVAADHLLGKSVEDAAALLAENALHHGEDYLWMGPVAFCYYAEALLLHLRSPAADDDPDFAYGMLGTFVTRLRDDGAAILPVVPILREFSATVSADADRLGLCEKLRARLPRRVAELESAIARTRAESSA